MIATASSRSAAAPARYAGLDGLRGLAALTVFIGHALNLLPDGRLPQHLVDSPLHLAFDGTAAVDLFFVLSGLVLALPFVGPRAQPLGCTAFWVRRWFRIFPAYWVSIGVAFCLRRAWFSPAALSDLGSWVRHLWNATVTTTDLVRHAILIGPSFDTNRLDPVVWSLVVEMRMSLLFPLVLVAVRRVRGVAGAAGAFAAALAASLAAPYLGIHTLTFLPLFVMGALVACLLEPLVARVRALPTPAVVALALAGALLFDVRFALGGVRFNYYASDLVIAFGSALLILLAAGRPGWAQVLSRPTTAFLGQISYSFYLIHLPVLLVVTTRLYVHLPSLWACAAAALLLSLGLAWLMARLVERPFLALGRVVAGRPRLRARRRCRWAAASRRVVGLVTRLCTEDGGRAAFASVAVLAAPPARASVSAARRPRTRPTLLLQAGGEVRTQLRVGAGEVGRHVLQLVCRRRHGSC